jgi:hypothetical protein
VYFEHSLYQTSSGIRLEPVRQCHPPSGIVSFSILFNMRFATEKCGPRFMNLLGRHHGEGSALRKSSSYRGQQEPRIRIPDWGSWPQSFPFSSVRLPGIRIGHKVGGSFSTAAFGRKIFCSNNKYSEWNQDSSVGLLIDWYADLGLYSPDAPRP